MNAAWKGPCNLISEPNRHGMGIFYLIISECSQEWKFLIMIVEFLSGGQNTAEFYFVGAKTAQDVNDAVGGLLEESSFENWYTIFFISSCWI